ncbi:MAG: phosphatase PAP2 family protein [Sphingobacteriaceae bacterium]|nr:MAG: phosphatase PAP2 family protein [Sphingobacteriaceae bacterium]
MRRSYCFYSLFFMLMLSCSSKNNWKKLAENPEYIHRSIREITEVMVFDIYSPPVASRIYAYISVAGYEAAINRNPKYFSLAGQLNGLKNMPKPDPHKKYSFNLAAVQAILSVGKKLVNSEGRIEAFHTKLITEFTDAGMPDEVFKNSVDYGNLVAKAVLAWAAKDHYKQTRSLSKYTVTTDEGSWKPTPPAYFKAVEPNWNKIRPFVVDSAQQFKPLPAVVFSAKTGSPFYVLAKAVYDAGVNLTENQKQISDFWDCNPFRMNTNGHTMFAVKKISPGGHWINISGLACKKIDADFVRTAETYTCVAVVIADAFISCWDEKYRSKVIRPETYINQYINQNWMPELQTPPFPEYTSGHSVISTASAVMLTKLMGDHFEFADSSEVQFGLPVRRFKSFRVAAQEAAISRFYGGIHYMNSIQNGITEGEQLATFITGKLKTRK